MRIRSSYTRRPYCRLTDAGFTPQRERRRARTHTVEQALNCSLLRSPSDNGDRHGPDANNTRARPGPKQARPKPRVTS